MEGGMWRHLQCPSVAAACVHAGFRWRAAAFTSQQLQTCLQAATKPTRPPCLCQPRRPGCDDLRSAAGGRGAEWSRTRPLCRSHHCTRPLRSGCPASQPQYQMNNRGRTAHAPGGAANDAAVLMCSVQFAAVCVDCIFHHRRSAIFRLEDALHTGPAFILQLFNRPRHSWDLTLSCTCVLLRSNVTFPFVRLEQTGCSTLRSIVHCVTFF